MNRLIKSPWLESNIPHEMSIHYLLTEIKPKFAFEYNLAILRNLAARLTVSNMWRNQYAN